VERKRERERERSACEIVLVFESEKEIIRIGIARLCTQRPTKVTFMKMRKNNKTEKLLVLCLCDDFIPKFICYREICFNYC
jgi:hypothetical protein